MNPGDKPTVSVVVPCYNSMRYLDACFGALARSTYPILETIVVDDGSSDETVRHLSRAFPEVRVIRSATNAGFAKTASRGMREAAGELVAILNVDTVVADDWLAMMVTAFRSDPAIGLLGCRMTDADGRVRHDGGIVEPNGLTKHITLPDGPEPVDVEYACGAGLLAEKSLLASLNYFDTGFSPMYYEDVDLCYRVRRLGRRVCCTPGAVMQHFETNDTGAESPQYLRRYHASRIRFVLKQFSPWDMLLAFPRTEGTYFCQDHAAGTRMILLRAYARNLLRLPWTMISRMRRVT